LTLFALLLERTAPPPEIAPAELRIVEMPTPAGLQGGAAVHHPAEVRPKPTAEAPKPRQQIKARRTALVPPEIQRAKPKTRTAPAVPLLPPSPSVTAKEQTEVAPSPRHASAMTETPGAGANQGKGIGGGVGTDSSGARAIYAPQPVIPDSLREEALQTVAVARFKVSYEGQVEVSLTTPTESPQINQLLLETLKRWRFFPAIKSGVAIDSQFDLRIPISIQ
jgi:protein TonB